MQPYRPTSGLSLSQFTTMHEFPDGVIDPPTLIVGGGSQLSDESLSTYGELHVTEGPTSHYCDFLQVEFGQTITPRDLNTNDPYPWLFVEMSTVGESTPISPWFDYWDANGTWLRGYTADSIVENGVHRSFFDAYQANTVQTYAIDGYELHEALFDGPCSVTIQAAAGFGDWGLRARVYEMWLLADMGAPARYIRKCRMFPRDDGARIGPLKSQQASPRRGPGSYY